MVRLRRLETSPMATLSDRAQARADMCRQAAVTQLRAQQLEEELQRVKEEAGKDTSEASGRSSDLTKTPTDLRRGLPSWQRHRWTFGEVYRPDEGDDEVARRSIDLTKVTTELQGGLAT